MDYTTSTQLDTLSLVDSRPRAENESQLFSSDNVTLPRPTIPSSFPTVPVDWQAIYRSEHMDDEETHHGELTRTFSNYWNKIFSTPSPPTIWLSRLRMTRDEISLTVAERRCCVTVPEMTTCPCLIFRQARRLPTAHATLLRGLREVHILSR